jgi:hypothetical protein
MKGRALQEVFGDLEISTNEEDSVRYGSIPAWAKENVLVNYNVEDLPNVYENLMVNAKSRNIFF